MDKATELFVSYMKTNNDIVISDNELAWEAVTLYQGELDHEFFPIENIEQLPDPLLFLMTSFVDQQEQEWIFCIVADNENSEKWYTAVCILEGKLIDSEIKLDLY